MEMPDNPNRSNQILLGRTDLHQCRRLLRWEDGSPVCPKCNAAQGERNHYWLANQKRWKCYACRKQFSVKVGTIFEDSPIGLTSGFLLCGSWSTARTALARMRFRVIWGLARRQHGSSYSAPPHLERYDRYPYDGPVEGDESFHGGKPKNMHRSRRLKTASWR